LDALAGRIGDNLAEQLSAFGAEVGGRFGFLHGSGPFAV
jgi:hypothetical protein